MLINVSCFHQIQPNMHCCVFMCAVFFVHNQPIQNLSHKQRHIMKGQAGCATTFEQSNAGNSTDTQDIICTLFRWKDNKLPTGEASL